jgi:GNAT superfamily N-acetyltransferase
MRPVVRADAEVLFRWLNAEDRRRTSFNTPLPVAWDNHVAWLDRHLADRDAWHAIALDNGAPAGQVRAEREGPGVVVSVYVDHAFRSRGVGRALIEHACDVAKERWQGMPLLAHVRLDNPESVAFFKRSGFSESERRADRAILQRMP